MQTEAIVRNLKMPQSRGEADVTTRGSGEKSVISTRKERSIEFDIIGDTASPHYQVLRDAFEAGMSIGLAVMSDAVDEAGSEGLWPSSQEPPAGGGVQGAILALIQHRVVPRGPWQRHTG